MRKIVITGPESSGKTTLASKLADHFKIQFVPEFARTYLANLDRPYQEADLLNIAKGQLEWHNDPKYHQKGIQICDTGFLVLKIWSDFKYGRCHPWIMDQFYNHPPDLYLLCHPDLPWHFDPLRENPDDRNKLMEMYQKELESTGFPCGNIMGEMDERLERGIEWVNGRIG